MCLWIHRMTQSSKIPQMYFKCHLKSVTIKKEITCYARLTLFNSEAWCGLCAGFMSHIVHIQSWNVWTSTIIHLLLPFLHDDISSYWILRHLKCTWISTGLCRSFFFTWRKKRQSTLTVCSRSTARTHLAYAVCLSLCLFQVLLTQLSFSLQLCILDANRQFGEWVDILALSGKTKTTNMQQINEQQQTRYETKSRTGKRSCETTDE